MELAELKGEVLRRCGRDQQARQRMIGGRPSPDDVEDLRLVDADNLEWLKAILREVGWPGRAVLGDDGANALWLLVQHADADIEFQGSCLEELARAVDAGDADAIALAYLTDRVRLARGERQIYGTQCDVREGKFVPRPLEDKGSVDERRRAVGLPPLSDYLAQMAVVYGDASRYPSRPG